MIDLLAVFIGATTPVPAAFRGVSLCFLSVGSDPFALTRHCAKAESRVVSTPSSENSASARKSTVHANKRV
jgi:hypothetical protein